MSSPSTTFPTCTVAAALNEKFVRPPYTTSVVLERLEKVLNVQRFYNTSNTDVSVLFDDDATRSDQQEYLVGLLWSSFALLILGILWLMLLTLCKLWGPSRVGFCSARRLKPPRPDEPTEALEKKEAIEEEQRRRRIARASGGVPFQHNGKASGFDDAPQSPSTSSRVASSIVSAPKKIVKGTIKAPKKVLSKARKQKRKLEQQFSKTKKFERFPSGDDFSDDDDRAIGNKDNDRSGEYTIDDEDDNDGSVLLLTQQDEREIADYEVAVLAYYKLCERRNARMRRIRAMASMCCACIFVASVLFVVFGTQSLTKATSTMLDGIDQIQDATSRISAQIKEWVALQDQTSQATAKFLDTTFFNEDFCPGNSGPFCTITSSSSSSSSQTGENGGGTDTGSDIISCDFSDLQQELAAGNVYDELWKYLDGTLALVVGEGVPELQADLERWNKYMEDAEVYLQTFNWSFWIASGCNLALGSISFWLLVAVLLLYFGHPLPRCFKVIRSWFFLPLMMLLTTFGWIFTVVFVSMSLANADACIDTPDDVILTILKSLQVKGRFMGTILPDFLSFFVNGCSTSTGTSPPRELDQKVVIVQRLVLPALQNVQNTITESGQTGTSLQAYCGSSVDVSPFGQLIIALATQLCTLVDSLSLVRDEFTCFQFYPLYEEIAYEGLCYQGTDGFVWAAATQLAMVILVMILLTLRVSYYELDEVAEESSGSCCSDWCCSTTNKNDVDEDDVSAGGDGYKESDSRKVTMSGITESGSIEDAQ